MTVIQLYGHRKDAPIKDVGLSISRTALSAIDAVLSFIKYVSLISFPYTDIQLCGMHTVKDCLTKYCGMHTLQPRAALSAKRHSSNYFKRHISSMKAFPHPYPYQLS
jgi:hypothetical protein